MALTTGREHRVALPATALVDRMFAALMAKARGGWDHSALITLLQDAAGSQIPPPQSAPITRIHPQPVARPIVDGGALPLS